MSTPTTFAGLVSLIIDYISLLIPLLFALIVIVLFWGVIKGWIINGGDQGSVDKGKQIAIAGVVALVVTIGVWGLVALLQQAFGLQP